MHIWSTAEDVRPISERIFLSLLTGAFMQVAKKTLNNDMYNIIINNTNAEINKHSAAKDIKADIYIIMLGTNDSKAQNWNPAFYKNDITYIINQVKTQLLSKSYESFLKERP